MTAILEPVATETREPGLLDYQRAWIEDDAPVAIFEKSRRIGADWCEALRAVRERITGARTCDYWYSSADETAAREFMVYVKMWARDVYGAVLNIVEGFEIFDGNEVKVMSITFPEVGGRRPRITAMTSSPKSFRSKGGDVCLSEFAHHDAAAEIWKAATPSTTWGGRIRVISTHKGEESMFNQLLVQARRVESGQGRASDLRASIHRITIDDAIDDGLVERINAVTGQERSRDEFREDCRRKCADDAAFAEEYLCKPSTETDSYFPYELLRMSVSASAPMCTRDVGKFIADIGRLGRDADTLLAGLDVGRKRDRTVLWCVGKFGGMRRTVGILELDNAPFDVQEMAIARLMGVTTASGARVRRLCIDATGIGMQLAERAVNKYRGRAEGVNFTAAVKEDLFTTLRRDLEEKTVTLPDDPSVLADINSVRKSVTAAGNVRFDADATDLGHADRAVALALALHADQTRASARFVKLEDRR